jgi:hypothetical protein
MTFAFRSVFFSVLCLSLMSLSCASRSSELESKIYDQSAQAGVAEAMRGCNMEPKLSKAACENLKDVLGETWRKAAKKEILEINNVCRDYRLSEDDCNLRKEERLKQISR